MTKSIIQVAASRRRGGNTNFSLSPHFTHELRPVRGILITKAAYFDFLLYDLT